MAGRGKVVAKRGMRRGESGKGRSRRGFTLLELVVVICIIGLLISLLLPSVRSSRGAAKRTQCRNNMKQIGLAMHNYHDVYGQFPLPGIVSASLVGKNHVDVGSAVSWGTELLPFLDQLNVYNKYSVNVAAFDAENAEAVGVVIPTYLCPSSPRDSNQYEFSMPKGTMVYPMLATAKEYRTKYGASDYIQISGVASEFRKYAYRERVEPQEKIGAMDQLLIVPDEGLRTFLGNPNLTRNSSINDITDGTSYTLLISENAGRNQLWRRGKKISDKVDAEGVKRQSMTGGGGWGDPFNQTWLNGRKADGTGMGGPCAINCSNEPDAGLYGFHDKVATVLMADGSARYLSESLDAYVLGGLVTKRGGETVGSF
ncbi:MAG: DUF1559 domain-containing protein [Planctomycetaceae bacterium]|nr:DUF1559 domain-containing protein [Planctomycetaceae bacterium]